MEEAATSVVTYLRANLGGGEEGERSVALARFYRTQPFEELEPELQEVVEDLAAARRGQDLRGITCLVLVASVGDLPGWCDRRSSRRHRAIPLAGQDLAGQYPIVSQLVADLGIDPDQGGDGGPRLFRRLEKDRFGVFHVPEALGSPYVPDQDSFVIPHRISSVLGFGSGLPDGSRFAVVLFSRTPVPPGTADSFSAIALGTKLAVLPFTWGPLLASDPVPHLGPSRRLTLERARSETLVQLLQVRQEAVVDQALRLERVAAEAGRKAEDLTRSRQALDAEVARKAAILDAALDAIITIEASGRVVEFNRAAESTFGYRREEALGREVAELIVPPRLRAAHRAGLARHMRTGEGPMLDRRVETWAQRKDGSELPVELAVTMVGRPGPPLFTGHLRDITDRRRAEAEAAASRERLAHVARTLQESLLAPVLPAVPRTGLACAYRPAGPGEEPGGDFYDVFEVAGDDWALVLGDVMGKGTEAAALTALVRYTIRAAAMRARRPVTVLRMLNEAVHRQNPERFCTLAYARLRTSGERLRLTLASGGHPPPLLVRADGGVAVMDTNGMLVGPFPRWEGSQQSVALGEGDAVVFYSDGVSEARRGRETFGLGRLRALVSELASSSAHSFAEAIRRAVVDFSGEPADDLAVLVLQALRPTGPSKGGRGPAPSWRREGDEREPGVEQ